MTDTRRAAVAFWGCSAVMLGCFADAGETTSESEVGSGSTGRGGSTSGVMSTANPDDEAGTSGADSSTSAGMGTTTSEDDTSDGSTGAPPQGECWDDPLENWAVIPFDTSSLTGGALRSMSFSPDGLSLAYSADAANGETLFIATRESRTDAFEGGVGVADWATDQTDVGAIRFAGSEELLSFLSLGEIATSRFADGIWWPLDPVQFDDPPTEGLGTPTLFDSGRGIMVDIRNGTVVDGTPALIAHEARRVDARSSFGELTRTVIPDWDPETPVICVVPSPDGEHIVFGGAFPAVWTDSEQALQSALDIWTSDRQDDGTWGEPVEISAISHDTLLSCPMSITDDGCEMTLRYFTQGGGETELAVATR